MPMSRKLSLPLTALFLLIFSGNMQAQFTLILIDRPFIQADTFSTSPEYIEYRKSGKRKIRQIERDKVFAIQPVNGQEIVVYSTDSLEGNWYSVSQMRDYILGQEDARKGYRKRANRGAVAGVFAGAGASAFSRLYGPAMIAIYPGVLGYLRPAFSEKYGFQPEMIENAFYREGYGTMAKRMSTRRAFWATFAGYLAGAVAFTIILR
jgi:hypothetical protein